MKFNQITACDVKVGDRVFYILGDVNTTLNDLVLSKVERVTKTLIVVDGHRFRKCKATAGLYDNEIGKIKSKCDYESDSLLYASDDQFCIDMHIIKTLKKIEGCNNE